MTRGAYEYLWRSIAKKLSEVHFSAHVLRYTYITRLFEAGLMYLAGHSSADMTLRVYTHYDRESPHKAICQKVRETFQRAAPSAAETPKVQKA